MARIVKPPVWEKRLDGWQAALVPVILISAALAIGAPRAVIPNELPLPRVNGAQLDALAQTDRTRAEAIRRQPLDLDVRRVGSAITNLNLATATERQAEVQEAKIALLKQVKQAIHHGDEPLLRLRAYQCEAFLGSLEAWSRSDDENLSKAEHQRLLEFGGDFLQRGQERGWLKTSPRTVRLTMDELRVLFKLRWNKLVGLEAAPFALTLAEERLRFGTLLEQLNDDDTAAAAKLVRRLATIDATYPQHLSLGIIAYRQGVYTRAARRFRDHLAARPDGPYTLRARNYLKASLDQVAELPQ